MKNNGLFSTLFIDLLKEQTTLNDAARGRMATLAQKWQSLDTNNAETLWDSFLKQALSYLSFVPSDSPSQPGMYQLYEDYGFSNCISVLFLVPPDSHIDKTSVGSFYPAKLLAQLEQRNLNWGILTDGANWRLYSAKSSRPFEDFVELPLDKALEDSDEAEYGLFERFFHIDSFTADADTEEKSSLRDESLRITKCRLDRDRDESEKILDEKVKTPFLSQVDEVLQYICNGFIHDTQKTGEEYTEEERGDIFESAVKLIYRCLFLFYAEARRLLPSDPDKSDLYQSHSIQTICYEARKFRWGSRQDNDHYDLWKHLKGLVDAVNEGDPEYGIMGYNGGLFDDQEEPFLGQHQLRNDFLSRALYLLAFVEPLDNDSNQEYAIPYEDLEVRHLGELYENILEYTVQLADADRFRRRSKKGVSILLASQTNKQTGDTFIKKGDVFFGESALERKQTGSYYTPESLVRFLNKKTIVQPLTEVFDQRYRQRFQELLDQAKSGHDGNTQRGAVQSAVAHVDQFVEEQVLKFKVCDPAMGSGHFLVDATNQMTRLVVALLEEIPAVEGANFSSSSLPNEWRRQITRHCIYGVDLNPLAVTLAKLSLWLNCFASEHKLTFLDYHIRHGNSLVGVRSLDQLASIPKRKKDPKKKSQVKTQLSFPFGDFKGVLGEVASEVSRITGVDEDDTDTQKAILEHALESMADLRPLADLYTAYLMDPTIHAADYKDLFERLAKGMSISDTLNFDLPVLQEKVKRLNNSHIYFHWPLVFPDVFGTSSARGFSATVGNPPWDIVKPSSQEFFSNYDPKFRLYKKQEASRASKKLMDENTVIAEKWGEYCRNFAEQSSYFKEPTSYSVLGKGDINTYKLFLEQFFTVLNETGHMGIVVPSGLYTDQGCQPLRKKFLAESKIDFLYGFENRWPTVFSAVDGRFKFITIGIHKGGKTNSFKCAFMQHGPERLPIIDKKALKMSINHIEKFSPNSLTFMEFNSQQDISIMNSIYDEQPLLGEGLTGSWNVKLRMGDYHLTNDSHKFDKIESILSDISSVDALQQELSNHNMYPIYEGKNCWFYDSNISLPTLCVESKHTAGIVFHMPRVGFRRIAASTNERTLIPCIIPSQSLCTYGIVFADDNTQVPLTLKERILYMGILGSFILDFVIRFQISTSISVSNGYSLPVYRGPANSPISNAILSRVCRLIASGSEFSDVWSNLFQPAWNNPEFWYPDIVSSDIYGPISEQNIRTRLRDGASGLSGKWSRNCGVHDRRADRRDMGDRAQLRAEIDAYVTHLYGLSRDDFAYILDTFPVLKKKEIKAFGEFMSKRKCLEEYDRIKIVLENSNEDSK
jgi:type I restriction-modification system DNA methylase subunit